MEEVERRVREAKERDGRRSVMGHEDATVTLSIYGHPYDRRRTDDAVRKALAG